MSLEYWPAPFPPRCVSWNLAAPLSEAGGFIGLSPTAAMMDSFDVLLVDLQDLGCRICPDYPLWRDFAYEYEHDCLAIDLINGSPLLREWVDSSTSSAAELDLLAQFDEAAWENTRHGFLLY